MTGVGACKKFLGRICVRGYNKVRTPGLEEETNLPFHEVPGFSPTIVFATSCSLKDL